MQKLNLFQRFFSPTPTFELYMQLLFAVIGYIASLVEKAGYISHSFFLVVSGLCAGAMVIAQFAVDHSAEIKAMISDPASAIGLIPEVKELVLQLISAYKTPPPVATLSAIVSDGAQLLQPAADAPAQTGSALPPPVAQIVQDVNATVDKVDAINQVVQKADSLIPEGAAIINDIKSL